MRVAVLMFAVASTLRLFARGTDFLIDPQAPISHFPADIGSADVTVWGITALVACAVLITAALLKSNQLAVYGCLAGSAFYTVFAVIVFPTTLGASPPTDWRIFTDYVGTASNWWILAGVFFIQHRTGKGAA